MEVKHGVDASSAEDFNSILEQIESGGLERDPGAEGQANEDEVVDDNELEDDDIDNDDIDEDTDLDEDEFEDEETNVLDDDEEDDTLDEDDSDEEENSPVEQDIEDDEDEETDTELLTDDDVEDTEDDSELSRYKKFYDEITNAEFVANGRKVKGFTTPEQIIKSQQMAHGFSEKMSGFKKYRPLMDAIKSNGMLEDSDKFNMMIDVMNGDKEAIKQLISNLDIDPILDLELDDISYEAKNHIATDEQMVINDTFETAKSYGGDVSSRLKEVVGSQWDKESFDVFLKDAETRKDLMEHLNDGTFDVVSDRITQLKSVDVDGTFSELNSRDQYIAALTDINNEQKPLVDGSAQDDSKKDLEIQKAKKKISEQKKAKAYQDKLKKKQAETNKKRRKAAGASGSKRSAKSQTYDPMSLDSEDFNKLIADMTKY